MAAEQDRRATEQDLRDRLAIVTGATGGLGFEVALGLARRGAEVVLTGRNVRKGEAALGRGRRLLPGAKMTYQSLDMASLEAIGAFAARVVAADRPVDILVNNAGVMAINPRQTTADGFELQFGTNYLGHFALTAGLMPVLTRGSSRVVNVASLAHRTGRMAFDDLQSERTYDPWVAYRQSKLAMLIFGRELQRRSITGRWQLRSVTAHPGWAYTDIIANGPGRHQPWAKTTIMSVMFRLLGQSATAGAEPILYAATAPDAEPGGYYGPSGRGEVRGPVGPSLVMPQAADPAAAERLWAVSEDLTGAQFPASPPPGGAA